MGTANLDLTHRGWGPFSPYYLGATRILGDNSGDTFTVALYVQREAPAAAVIPDNIFGYVQNNATGERRTVIRAVPENMATDFSSFGIRYYLDDDNSGDTVLARFSAAEDGQLRCDLTFTNTSASRRRYRYGFGAVIDSPAKRIRLREQLRPWWIAGKEYANVQAYQRVFGMGCRMCVSRAFEWSIEDGSLAQAFGGWPDDRVTYRTRLPHALRDGFLYFRFVKYGSLQHPWEVVVNGKPFRFEFPRTQALPGGAHGKNKDAYREWRLLRIPVGEIADPEVTLTLRPIDPPGNDRARIWLDGILLHEGRLDGDNGGDAMLSTDLCDEWIEPGPQLDLIRSAANAVELSASFPGGKQYPVRIATAGQQPETSCGRDSLNAVLRQRFGQPPHSPERDARGNPWICIDAPFVEVDGHSSATVSFTVDVGNCRNGATPGTNFAGVRLPETPADRPAAEVIARLRDSMLFNINYPFVHNGKPSPFLVPSKFFPIPYSWDAGMAAIGMALVDTAMAADQVAFYLADPDTDYPFFSCGSPVPTQFFAIWEIWQHSQQTSVLQSLYPGAKRMYDFYLGRFPGSVVNAHNDYLLSTYAYNYNLGIDDHPIQLWAELNGLTHKGLYSIILMPQILRAARIMRNVALLLGLQSDAEQYATDAEQLAAIVDGKMWDDDSKLYGWLYRDDDGDVRLVRIADGCAGDRSACAFLPLFGGLTTHAAELLPQLDDPIRFNTPFGISSVDRAAPTYNPNGYWNGAVWAVMQWFIWRGLLEAGDAPRARSVATKILNTWQREFDRARYLGEHFVLKDEKMSGAPNFAGLSSALLPMHAAYFKPYCVTTPFDVIVRRKEIDTASGAIALSVDSSFFHAESYILLANLEQPNVLCRVTVNGSPATDVTADQYGHLSLNLPRSSTMQTIGITPCR